jgi:anti-sigma factor ChrR (cupin superfamily)
MKYCQDIRPELSAYLDGELTPSQRTEVEAHLASCPRCQEELAELKTLAAGMAALPKLEPAPQFLAEVRHKIARGDNPEPKTWQDHLFRPVWLKVPLEAAALIVIVALVQRFQEPTPVSKVARLRMARADSPKTARADAVQAKQLAAAQGAEQPLDTLANNESPSGPVSDKSAGEVRRRAFTTNGSVGGLTIAPPLAAAEVAAVAQGLGIEPSRLGDVVIVPARNLHDVQGRAQQLAAKCNGRIIPVPPSKEVAGHLFFVELPREYAASFKLDLLQASAGATPSSGGAMGLGPGVLTGNHETNAVFSGPAGLALTNDVTARESATTVLEIMIVTPAN